jgi:hypothetical protein
MLALEDPTWATLSHAYGSAANIPDLLACIAEVPARRDSRNDTWEVLWSSLCHQDSVFDASFAAVPHIVAALSLDPSRATPDFHYFALPVAIELARMKEGRAIPAELEGSYTKALRTLAGLSQHAASEKWDIHARRAAEAALALSRGEYRAARTLLDPDDGEE